MRLALALLVAAAACALAYYAATAPEDCEPPRELAYYTSKA